jgi:hypothetical protein
MKTIPVVARSGLKDSPDNRPATIAIPHAQAISAKRRSLRRPILSEREVPVRAAMKEVTELTKFRLYMSMAP